MFRNKAVLGNIALILLAVALVAFLAAARIQDKKEAEQAMKELEAESTDNAEELSSELAESLDIPKFVIWGDEGALNGGDQLAEEFNSAVDEHIFQELKNEYSKKTHSINGPDLSVQTANMGVSHERINEIIARSGARQIVTEEGMTIPAEKGARVTAGFKDDAGNYLRFAAQEEDKFGAVRISDIEGRLTEGDGTYDEDHIKFAFERSENGEETFVPARTPVETEGAGKYTGCVPILYFDSMTPGEDQAEAGPDLTDNEIYSAIRDFTLIVQAHKTNEEDEANETGEAAAAEEADIYAVIVAVPEGSAADTALAEEFGEHYIRADRKAEEMTGEEFAGLGSKVYESFESQGLFGELKEQVKKGISELDEI